MKKSLLGAGLALALALSACSGDGGSTAESSDQPADTPTSAAAAPPAGETQSLTFLTHWGPDQVTMLETAAGVYSLAHPEVTITVQAVPFANLLSTLRTQGSSADGPAIVGIYDAWLPELVRDGLAAPAPADVSATVQANWPAGVVTAASQDGQVYGIPNEIDLYQLNYNQDLFDQAGIEEPPATWDELVDAAAKITALGDGIQGIGFITNWVSGVDHPFLSLLASNGGSFLNADGTAAALDSPEALETAQLYQTLRDAGSTDATMSPANANTTGPYLDNFANGKTGMIIMANWWESSLRDAMGDSFANVKTAPIPIGPSGTMSSSISYSWMTMVNGAADAGRQAAAWAFLDWLNAPESGADGTSAMGGILLSMGILPTRQSDIDANADGRLDTSFLASYVTSLPDATPFPTVIGGPAAADALQKHIESLLAGQSDAEAAMQAAVQDVNSALQSAQG
jgi:multiple sugar transport system substrate-binding protein